MEDTHETVNVIQPPYNTRQVEEGLQISLRKNEEDELRRSSRYQDSSDERTQVVSVLTTD